MAVTHGRAGDLVDRLDALRPFPRPTVDLVAVILAAAGRQDEARAVPRDAPAIGYDFFRSLRLTARALAILELQAVDEAEGVHEQLSEFSGQSAAR